MPATTIPHAQGHKPKTYGANRVCAHESCSTRLSTYNKARKCWNHSYRRERLSLAEHNEAMFELADLMAEPRG